MYIACVVCLQTAYRRSPHGLRGLKSEEKTAKVKKELSQPSWAAWIEIILSQVQKMAAAGRSPHGLRGLKSTNTELAYRQRVSQPSWAAWIEICI